MIRIDLAIVWAFIIAFAVFVYVVMDGFDLGLGILFPLFPEKRDRDVIMNSVAPVWDGNETWLVLGGGGMMAAFPLAYAVLMPALYTPMIAMLLGLVFRGVAFEFRWRTTKERNKWDIAFFGGSLLADAGAGHSARRHPARHPGLGPPLCRRLVGLADAVQHPDRRVAGDRLCAAGSDMAGDENGRRIARPRLSSELGAVARDARRYRRGQYCDAVPHVQYTHRWFAWPNILLTAPVPIAVAAITVLLLRSLANKYDYQPFFLTLALFALSYAGLGISMFPYIVPQSITIWEAASPENSQIFMLFGVAVLIPLILGYTAWAYWVFRGKVKPESGYH
jgi:cytochrome d ubiquinol oxidase subunit II